MWPRLTRIVCQVVCAMPGSRRQEARSTVYIAAWARLPIARLSRPPWFAPSVLRATRYVVCCKSSLHRSWCATSRSSPKRCNPLPSARHIASAVPTWHGVRCAPRGMLSPHPCPACGYRVGNKPVPSRYQEGTKPVPSRYQVVTSSRAGDPRSAERTEHCPGMPNAAAAAHGGRPDARAHEHERRALQRRRCNG